MGIAPEIGENLLWAAERTLGIDDPFDLAQGIQMAAEWRRIDEVCEPAEELKLCLVERRSEAL
jgi:hypothetical protein